MAVELLICCICSSLPKAALLQLAEPDSETRADREPPQLPEIDIHLLWLYFWITPLRLVVTDWRTGIAPRPDRLRRISITERVDTE